MIRISPLLLCLALAAPGFCTAADSDNSVYSPDDTAHPKLLGHKLAVNLLEDQKAIWTSPLHMDRNAAKWWLVIGAATAALVATDKHTINTFENGPTQVRWGENISRLGAAYSVVPITGAFYAVGLLVDNPKARETGLLGAEALFDSLVVQEVLKPIAGRNRPGSSTEKGSWFEGGSSFPSGHSIEAWSLAAVVAHEYGDHKWVPFVAYGLATAIGTSRFVGQHHFPSDILAGGAMGYFIGRYVVNTHEDRGQRFKARIAPILNPSAGAYGIAVQLAR
jgi:membrane-associated phospholipid phosphatase